MSDLTVSLQNAAAKNRELLATLAQTDYATTALKQNTSYYEDLERQLKITDGELKKLHRITEDERKDHLKYRDSTFKRYAHKMGGKKGSEKFTSKQEKEEREFLEAWQKEREAEERKSELTRALATAHADSNTLKADTRKNAAAQTELDQMYNSIFSGPTPEIPEEDRMEQTVQQSRQWLEQCQANFNNEKAAGEALRRVEARLKAAAANMQEALSMSRMDMFGGGTFTDIMERDALSRASVAISEALRHMDHARHLQPAIRELDQVNIDMGHMVSDMLFDNIFTDMAQHDRIKASDAQLQRAGAQLQEQIRLQLERAGGAKAQLAQATENTEGARLELQRIRAEAFEVLASGGAWNESTEAPPPYTGVQAGATLT